MILDVKNVSREFTGPSGTIRALDDVSLTLDAGQLVAIRGPSGCGKTTLLLVVGGLLRPGAGDIRVNEVAPYRLTADPRAAFRAATIGFVFQQFHLVPYLSVLENILTPALVGADSTLRDRAWELICRLGLELRAYNLPANLSSGERQRTAIARAMLKRPKLLLADEPTGNLDRDNADIVLNALADFAHDGGAVLLVTHDDRISNAAHRTLQMKNGRFI